MYKSLTAAIVLIGFAGAAHAGDAREIGYPEGALGYGALVEGDVQSALDQLRQSQPTLAEDPAHMINLGYAYAETGRIDAAAEMYRAALASDRSFDIVLSTGEVTSTRDAARRALRELQPALASR